MPRSLFRAIAAVAAAVLLIATDVHSDEVGFTGGEASVDPTGAANFRIPFVVPPGRGGIAPEFALIYNSRAGNGQLGVGWGLEGLSAITRCADDWRYTCLDGQRLVGVGGGQMRTEIDSLRRITQVQAGGGTGYEVRDNAGLIFEYGSTANSRISANGTVQVYALTSIRDRNGNQIDFTYQQGAGAEYWLDEVSYSPNNTVTFVYESRTDQPVSYRGGTVTRLTKRLAAVEVRHGASLIRRYNLTYQQGIRSARSLLATVTECDGASQCFPATNFQWQHGSRGFAGGQRSLTQINAFGYQLEHRRYIDHNGDGWPDLLFYEGNRWRLSLGPSYGAVQDLGPCLANCPDQNEGGATFDRFGDGTEQWMLVQGTTYLEMMELASGYPSTSTGILVTTPDNMEVKSSTLIDMNRDGYADLVVLRRHTTQSYAPVRVDIYVNDGQGGFNTSPNSVTYEYSQAGAARHLTPVQFSGPGGNAVLLDVCLEIATGCDWRISAITGLGDREDMIISGADLTAMEQVRVVDVNGDGLSDLMYAAHAAPYWNLLLNRDGYFVPFENAIPQRDFGAYQLDYYGDGRTIIAVPRTDDDGPVTGARIEYWAWEDDGTVAGMDRVHYEADTEFDTNQRDHLDLTGDGVVDRLEQDDFEGPWHIRNGDPVMNDLMVLVNEGVGRINRQSRFFHVPLTNSNFYYRGPPDIQNGYLPAAGALYVVGHVATSTGHNTNPDSVVMTSYRYGRGLIHRTRGFAGFEEVAASNENTGIHTTNYHEYLFPYTGMVRRTIQRVGAASPTPMEWGDIGSGSLANLHFQLVDDCAELGFSEFNPGLCDPNEPNNGPQNTHVYGGLYTSGALVSESDFEFESGPILGASTNSHYPRMTRSVVTEYDLGSTLEIKETETQFTYDGDGNAVTVVAQTTGGGATFTTTTNSSFQSELTTWCVGRVTSTGVTHAATGATPITRNSAFTYQNCQLKTESILAGGLDLTTIYEFDQYGNRISVARDGGEAGVRSVTSTPDATGTVVSSVTNALGHSETRQWDLGLGVMTSQTGPNGLTTTWDYDGFGRRIEETRPSGTGPSDPERTTQWLREWCGTCRHPAAVYYVTTTEAHVTGPASITEFDMHGREVAVAQPGFTGTLAYVYSYYDLLGRLERKSLPTTETNPASATIDWVEYEYDALGRVIEEIRPRAGDRTIYAYNGLQTTVTTFPDNPSLIRTIVSTVDAMDRLVSVTDAATSALPNSVTTTFQYDAIGNRSMVTDGEGGVTAMGYDARGNLVSMSTPEMGAWSYVYNAFGELVHQEDARGYEVAQYYDPLGRLVQRVDLDDASAVVNDTLWLYDQSLGAGVGRLSVMWATGQDPIWEGYTYDTLGQLTDTFTMIDGEVYWTSTDYDGYGRPIVVSYPDIATEAAPGGGAPAAPASVTVPSTSNPDGSFQVSWAQVSGSDINYHVEEIRDETDPSSVWRIAGYTSGTTLLLTSRAHDQEYRIRVRACLLDACSAWTTSGNEVQVWYQPAAPQLNPLQDALGAHTVSWGPVHYVDYYELEQSADGTTGWTPVSLAGPLSTSHTDAVYSGGRYYRVRGRNGGPPGAWSSVVGFSVPTISLGSLNSPTIGNYSLSWISVAGATSYQLEERKDGGGWAAVSGCSALTCSIDNVDDPGLYEYRVRACDGSSCGDDSAIVSTTVVVAPTVAPSNVGAPANATGNFGVSWSAVADATSYNLNVTVVGGVGDGTISYYPGVQSPAQVIVAYENAHHSKVQACNIAGCGPYSNAVITHVNLTPAPPTMIVPSTSSSLTYYVEWEPLGEISATLEMSPNGVSGWYVVPPQSGGESNDIREVTVAYAGTWYHRASICNNFGCSGWSAVDQTVVQPGPSGTPTLTAPATNSTGSYSVFWTTVSGATTYELQRRLNGGAWTTIQNTSSPSLAESGRANGSWGYQVRACNAGGCGNWSAVKTTVVTLGAGTPSLSVIPGWAASPANFSASWNAISGATSYQLEQRLDAGAWIQVYSGTATSRTFLQMPAGNWQYRVRACIGGSCGTYSLVKAILVEDTGGCGPYGCEEEY